ncbi:MAG: barstar family protein [Vicinamibacterales bacterium]
MTRGLQEPEDPRVAALLALVGTADTPAFVEVAPDLLATPDLRVALARAGWRVAVVDRAPVVDKATLLHALYQSGEYPAGFGFNWDALLDALRDLSWLEPAVGIALLWRHPDVLQSRDPESAATFAEIVAEAAAHRAEAGYPPLRLFVPQPAAG